MERGASTNAMRNHHNKPTLSALKTLQTAYLMKNKSEREGGGGGVGRMDEDSNRRNRQQNQHAIQVREQDQYMPIANVIRIMRRILPPHAKISDDAKETIQECVSEYISFITGEANDRCQREQRKTVTAEDVLWAMGKLGFDDYIEPLTIFLTRYREIDGGERGGGGGGSIRGGSEVLYLNSSSSNSSKQGSVESGTCAAGVGMVASGFLPVGYLPMNYDPGYYTSSDHSGGSSSSSQPLSLLSYDPFASYK